MSGSYKILDQIIEELKSLDGIVAYSVFQLPMDNKIRYKVLNHVIKKNRVFTTCLPRGLRSKILKNTYMNNGPEQFKELGLTISGLINKSRLKGGVMIFFPSYKNMYEVSEMRVMRKRLYEAGNTYINCVRQFVGAQ